MNRPFLDGSFLCGINTRGGAEMQSQKMEGEEKEEGCSFGEIEGGRPQTVTRANVPLTRQGKILVAAEQAKGCFAEVAEV